MRKIGALLIALLALQGICGLDGATAVLAAGLGGGGVAGDRKYTGPHHLFSVIMPIPIDGFGERWKVKASVKKGQYEEAAFYGDFGEMYRIAVIENAEQRHIADVAQSFSVSQRYQIANPPQCIEETKVNTQFGPGVLRLYSAKAGALVTVTHDVNGKWKSTIPDSYIVVLAVRHDRRILLAAYQDDLVRSQVGAGLGKNPSPTGVEEWKQDLKDSVQKFFATLQPSRANRGGG